MKLFWTGTDSLMLVDYSMREFKKKPYWFLFRIIIRILDFFIEGHYCDSENVADNIRKFGTKKPIKVKHDCLNYPKPFEKKQHKGFNVVYYSPKSRLDQDFIRWLYGTDIVEEVMERLPEVNFIRLDGTKDMSEIYPITDFYLRPNRHDGASRMIQECRLNNIPYYHSWTDSSDVDYIVELIKLEYGTIK